MALPYDELGGAKRLKATVRFIVGDVEVHTCAGNRRQICILAEQFLRYMHARGLRAEIVVQCRDNMIRLEIESYLQEVSRELDMRL
ncbi:hypothetical protein GOFOIKOB_2931 [Methylobacterium tardum]|uniref:Uncharacterized protein n=1 Tax=Methylobacterium tardum TaxID=374432 RepID=A0AA37WTC5_9HYPH|nr:hypothetical protein [Methylobacterium tardum]URD38285.1 hypothetical protein M6G65_07490 [Methylobacterium tardum]GJE49891.1 hypothetical protein GOFOIKOB_2931 [Methylobacterium tardum]GLS70093.1 hypothetical protein GCM10007890_21060 [Methylobacterium tardum]